MVTAIGFCGGFLPAQVCIQLATFSKDAHCFALLDDCKTIIDATYKHGVKDRSIADIDCAWMDFIWLRKAYQTGQLISFEYGLRREIGKPYDESFLKVWEDRDWQEDDSWWCSELIGAKMIELGMIGHVKIMNRLSPRNLRRRIEESSEHKIRLDTCDVSGDTAAC